MLERDERTQRILFVPCITSRFMCSKASRMSSAVGVAVERLGLPAYTPDSLKFSLARPWLIANSIWTNALIPMVGRLSKPVACRHSRDTWALGESLPFRGPTEASLSNILFPIRKHSLFQRKLFNNAVWRTRHPDFCSAPARACSFTTA